MQTFEEMLGVGMSMSWEKTFHVSACMVSKFVELTGDNSSVHMNEEYTKKSMYRSNIVHGMLSVLFLSGLPLLQTKDWQFSFTRISARFLHPIFIGDELLINYEIIGIDRENQVFLEYNVKKAETQTVLTTGYIALTCRQLLVKNSLLGEHCTFSSDNGIVLNSLVESDYEFEQISKGDERELSILVSQNCAYGLYEILKKGLQDHSFNLEDWYDYNSSINLIASCVCSTFVGMCIPGRNAIFMGFDLAFHKSLQWDHNYTFNGKVSFKSTSVLSLVESISIHKNTESKEPFAIGKINVKMNPPQVKMPTISSINVKAGGLQLKDKVVLITGGSGGLGETTAKLLALHGAKVGVNYFKSQDEADRIVKEICDHGGEACAIQADITDRDQVKKMIKTLSKTYGAIHVLVNNAVKDAYPIAFRDLTWNDIQKNLDVTLKGTFICCQEVLPMMIGKGNGKIVNISTIFSDNPPANQAKYVISKNALVGLTRSLAVDLAPHNIQVNLVVPSFVETNLTKHVSKLFLEKMKKESPMRRNAEPIDVAKAVLFLASSLASFTTGQKIMVTGGHPPFL